VVRLNTTPMPAGTRSPYTDNYTNDIFGSPTSGYIDVETGDISNGAFVRRTPAGAASPFDQTDIVETGDISNALRGENRVAGTESLINQAKHVTEL
jgi:hypothetical protein